jgi:hypothetical protein
MEGDWLSNDCQLNIQKRTDQQPRHIQLTAIARTPKWGRMPGPKAVVPPILQQTTDLFVGNARLQTHHVQSKVAVSKRQMSPRVSTTCDTKSATNTHGERAALPTLVQPPSSQIWPLASTVLENSCRPSGWLDAACGKPRSAKSERKKHTGTPRDPKLEPAAAPARVDPAILFAKTIMRKQAQLQPLLLVHHVQRRVPVSKVQTSLRLPAETRG